MGILNLYMANELGTRVGNIVDMSTYAGIKDLPILVQTTKEPKKLKSKEKTKKVKKPIKQKGS